MGNNYYLLLDFVFEDWQESVQVREEVRHTRNLRFSTLSRQLPCCMTICWLLRWFWCPIFYSHCVALLENIGNQNCVFLKSP